MKLRSNSLHFEIVKGTTKHSGYIRNSYREDGKVKHQTISKINGVSLEQLQNMKAAFDGNTIKLDDIKITGGREYGASSMLFSLAKKIGLDNLVYSRNEPWVRNVLAMIIGRITYQGSKLSLSQCGDYSALWEICGVENVDVNRNCYDALDALFARQNSIQKKLAKKHLDNGSVILYDITSSYLEGEFEGSALAEFGYNRDKKRGKKQIVIALVCTKAGCPVAVEVFRGNTTDCTTVLAKITEIKDTFGISKFTFVGDRGMLTQKHLDAVNGENYSGVKTITALTHSAIKKLCEHENVQLSMFDEDAITEVILPEEPNVRYALKLNPVRRKDEFNQRIALIEKTEVELSEKAIPKRKTDDSTLAARAAKIFNKYKTEKYFNWEIVDTKIVFSRNENVRAEEEIYDGFYVIRSDVSADDMNISQVVEAYRSLINVEQAFRNMKTVQLEMRPIFHKTDDRIKAHVFLCTLSYYLLWHMNKALKTLYASNSRYTTSHVLEIMKSLQIFNLNVSGVSSNTIAEPTDIQKHILDLLIGDM